MSPGGAPKCRAVGIPRLTLVARRHMPGAGGPGFCVQKSRFLLPRWRVLLLATPRKTFAAGRDGPPRLLKFQAELLKSRRSHSRGIFNQSGPVERQRRQIDARLEHAVSCTAMTERRNSLYQTQPFFFSSQTCISITRPCVRSVSVVLRASFGA